MGEGERLERVAGEEVARERGKLKLGFWFCARKLSGEKKGRLSLGFRFLKLGRANSHL